MFKFFKIKINKTLTGIKTLLLVSMEKVLYLQKKLDLEIMENIFLGSYKLLQATQINLHKIKIQYNQLSR